ncbi:MAG: 5-oxoprolinase subunit PxpB [Planctomycetes bacterium]|nr:5-oxoprolinase subunit PxpB [Planctomycetota bacterium]
MASNRLTFHCRPVGDRAVLFTLGDRIDAEVNARALECARAVLRSGLPGIVDVVPAYASLLVHFEPRAWADRRRAPHVELIAALEPHLLPPAPARSNRRDVARDRVIPVVYGGSHGPDLERVARHCGMTPDEVVRRHSAAVYRVAFLGFAPGFPYLLGLDPALATPRRPTPRTRVEPGAVGIAGAQTGVYPLATPGGWQLIGRTPRRLFDPTRDPPAWLEAGDRVCFVPIDGVRFANAEVAWDD